MLLRAWLHRKRSPTLARQNELLRSGVGTRSAFESAQTAVRQAEADMTKVNSADAG